jgi:hypothetical protein
MHSSTGGNCGDESLDFVNPLIRSNVPKVPRNLHLKIFSWVKDISTVAVDFEIFRTLTLRSISAFSSLS